MTKLEDLEWYKRYKELFGAFKSGEGDKFYRDYEYKGYKRVWATWPLLEKKIGKKKPSEYQIVTYALSYWADPKSPTYIYDKGPFELGTDHLTQKWYRHFRDNSPFIKPLFERRQWHDYEDPYKLTYWNYNNMADDNETFLDKIYEEIVSSKYDLNLSEESLEFYRDVYDPIKYIWHIFQMESMYLASMSPTSSVTNVFVFMGMDHLRRVQRIAQRIKMLDFVYPSYAFGTRGRDQFERSSIFQPTRKLLEKMLVTYDSGEALTAFNLAVKYVYDELLLNGLSSLGTSRGDEILKHIHSSFYNDTLRHRHQITELFNYAFNKEPSLRDVVRPWLNDWKEETYSSIEGFKDVFKQEYDNIVKDIRNGHEEFLKGLGL
ncbi:toluene monooxygenase [Acidianus brierleyi]|uniref:Toluene monooxygenase n=1 Tax=Acidianus brierleyi TaxID=41673 RepID=A0A2U9IJB0_9CREN|nr:toluene monooxygenase [Acidianus brierleyi]AWR96056.1 toluene monooxygenase [Acidianus brierleyi]